jgi:hypothetical protein
LRRKLLIDHRRVADRIVGEVDRLRGRAGRRARARVEG